MNVRPERPADFDAIHALVAAAFQQEAEARLVLNLRASSEYRPELALVAERAGEIVGHVMVCDVDLVDAGTVHRVLSLAPLAVLPAMQGQGIGSALVPTVVERADEMGESVMVLQGNPRYYSRFGFVDSRTMGIDMALPDWAPPEAGQARKLAGYDPGQRGTIRYSSAFDGLED